MLNKLNRLKRKKDFENVARNGRQVNRGFLVLKFVPNKENNHRFGFVISKKVLKRAVDRNKIKRQLRHAVRGAISEKEIGHKKIGHDIVFFARFGIEKHNFEELEKAVKSLLNQVNLL